MKILLFSFLLSCCSALVSAQQPVDYVNPFIGTSNYGTTNPGAICPQGMMSVTPFNVMGSTSNKFDKGPHLIRLIIVSSPAMHMST